MNIQEIKNILKNNPDDAVLAELKKDSRVGVQKLLESYYKKIAKLEAEKKRFSEMLVYENRLYAEGYKYIAGVDEAGRGPLAGPLVIAAVILPQNIFISGLNDSKQVSAKKREEIYQQILKQAAAISVNIVSISNIDELNIYRATQKGMEEVLQALDIKPDAALIDAMPVELEKVKVTSLVHGDALSASIAAASIVAKVTRDRMMEKLGVKYPEYHFEANKGYGSQEHMRAINEFGATKWHRRSYEPVKSMNLPPVKQEDNILYSPLQGDYEYEPEG